jgi:hypothetical protein
MPRPVARPLPSVPRGYRRLACHPQCLIEDPEVTFRRIMAMYPPGRPMALGPVRPPRPSRPASPRVREVVAGWGLGNQPEQLPF